VERKKYEPTMLSALLHSSGAGDMFFSSIIATLWDSPAGSLHGEAALWLGKIM
jgi:hypothetical protein